MGFSFVINRNYKRWKYADMDGDDLLNFQEWTCFLFPENFPRMNNAVVDVI